VTQATGTAGTGTPLTADGEGGIVEIDTALKWFWDNWRLSPGEIWVSSQEAPQYQPQDQPGSRQRRRPACALFVDVKDGLLVGAVMARSYINRFSMTGAAEIPIRLHPNLPAGTVLFNTKVLPYSLSNVAECQPDQGAARLFHDRLAVAVAPLRIRCLC